METNIRFPFCAWPVYLPHTENWKVFFFFPECFTVLCNVSRGNLLAGLAVLNQNICSELTIKVAKHDTSRTTIQENDKPGDDWFIGVIE